MYAIIGGVTLELVKGSPLVDQRIEERSTAEFTVIDSLGTASYQRGQPVALYDAADTLIFGGVIDTSDKVAMAPGGGLYHPIRCMDWHYLVDKRLVVAAYTTTDAGAIVTDIHTNYLVAEGVGIGSIQTGPEIPEAVFNYVTVAEAFDALAEMAGFTWFIDENKDLYFVDRATYLAPWNWSVATPKPAGSKAILSEGNPLYRNYQYIRGGMGLTTLQVENRTGDGTTYIFIMGYPLAKEPTIVETPPGLPAKTVGIKGLETGKDYYWSKGDSVISAAIAPDIADAIQFTYQGQYPLITLAKDEGAQIARAAIEGGTGIVETIAYESHESGASSQESARSKLTDYCRDAAKFHYPTTDSGIRPGQLQVINYPLLGLNNTEMLIESVVMTSHGNLVIYDITAVVGPVIGSWTRFFSAMLQKQTAAIRIGDERLLVLLQQKEPLALVEAPTSWQQLKGQYCWAPKTNGAGLREAYWDFFTWG